MPMPRRHRFARSFASLLLSSCALATGVALYACSGDDDVGTQAAPDASAHTDAMANDTGANFMSTTVDANADAGEMCDADVSGLLTEVANSAYEKCAQCLEVACDSELTACADDCACSSAAFTLFTCIGGGGSPTSCAESVISGSNDSNLVDFVSCSSICGSECKAQPADAGADAAHPVDAATDAGTADAAADAADGG